MLYRVYAAHYNSNKCERKAKCERARAHTLIHTEQSQQPMRRRRVSSCIQRTELSDADEHMQPDRRYIRKYSCNLQLQKKNERTNERKKNGKLWRARSSNLLEIQKYTAQPHSLQPHCVYARARAYRSMCICTCNWPIECRRSRTRRCCRYSMRRRINLTR